MNEVALEALGLEGMNEEEMSGIEGGCGSCIGGWIGAILDELLN